MNVGGPAIVRVEISKRAAYSRELRKYDLKDGGSETAIILHDSVRLSRTGLVRTVKVIVKHNFPLNHSKNMILSLDPADGETCVRATVVRFIHYKCRERGRGSMCVCMSMTRVCFVAYCLRNPYPNLKRLKRARGQKNENLRNCKGKGGYSKQITINTGHRTIRASVLHLKIKINIY